MDVVEVTVHPEVDVVAMRHGLVPTPGAMEMRSVVAGAGVRRTCVGVGRVDVDDVLVGVELVDVVEVTVVEVVDVGAVGDRRVTAARAMGVEVVGVGVDGVAHGSSYGRARETIPETATPPSGCLHGTIHRSLAC
jgi:hypothetical protein